MWFPCVKLISYCLIFLYQTTCFLQGTFSKCILFVFAKYLSKYQCNIEWFPSNFRSYTSNFRSFFDWLKWDPHKAYRLFTSKSSSCLYMRGFLDSHFHCYISCPPSMYLRRNTPVYSTFQHAPARDHIS